MKTAGLFLLLCLMLLSFSTAKGEGRIIYIVPPGSPGVNSALPHDTWLNAATNLAILGNVSGRGTMGQGDTFLISNGVYHVESQINPLCPGATVKSVSTNPDDVVVSPGSSYNGLLFYHNNGGWGEMTTWENLTFKGARGRVIELYGATNVTYRNCVFIDNAGASSAQGGGALRSTARDLKLFDCSFISNSVNNYTGSGGAIYVAHAFISNCVFIGNSARSAPISHGGAVCVAGNLTPLATSVIVKCVFSNNMLVSTSSRGGAGSNSRPLRMYDCDFYNNNTSTISVGGGWYIGHSDTVISGSRFVNNQAEAGGGVSFSSVGYGVVSNCNFYGNSAIRGGGASFYYGHDGLLVNCVFSNNGARVGGAVGTYPGGGEVRNCLIANNTANDGGGIRISSVLGAQYSNTVSSCVISGNTATNHGGGIALVSGYIGPYEVRNSIVYFNTSSSEATKDLRNTGTPEPAPYYHCCTSSNFPVGMNITNNPLFVKAEDNDFRLSMGSLCINAGTNMPWMETAVDLDDRIRIRYEAVDIGCYEYIYPGTTVFFQ